MTPVTQNVPSDIDPEVTRTLVNDAPRTKTGRPARSQGKEHEGATESEMTDIPAPRGPAFKDEPKQG
jgi:hypothetical protein